MRAVVVVFTLVAMTLQRKVIQVPLRKHHKVLAVDMVDGGTRAHFEVREIGVVVVLVVVVMVVVVVIIVEARWT